VIRGFAKEKKSKQSMVVIARTDEYAAFHGDDDSLHFSSSISTTRNLRSVRSCIRALFLREEKEEALIPAYLQNPENVDSPEWHEFVSSADRARKAALRVVFESANGREKVKGSERVCGDDACVEDDAQSTESILDDAVRCLFALEAWTGEVLPALSARIEQEGGEAMTTRYLARSKLLLHSSQLQSSILGVLEIAVFDSACSVGKNLLESNVLDLVDYCVERLESLNNTNDRGEQQSARLIDSENNDEDLCHTMSCLSILRSVCDSVSALPLSVIARLISKHKIHSHLLPTLLSKAPWFRGEDRKVFNDGRWISGDSLSHMPKPEAQVWLCLRALLAEPACSGRHDYHDSTFERSLVDLKSKLLGSTGSSRLIDQIPQLGGDGLQRAIVYHLHEIQRNKRAEVETTLCNAHILTRNMNAMKKGEETCTLENSTNEKGTRKKNAFTLIQPIQPPSFRTTVREEAKEHATRWVDAFISRHSENFDVYAARVRQEVLTMFNEEEYDVFDNIKSVTTDTNVVHSMPQTTNAHTVCVQFLNNDNEEEHMEQHELLYTFDADDEDCRLPDADVVLSQDRDTRENINNVNTKYIRGERFKCTYAGEGYPVSSPVWFSNPRYVCVSLRRNNKNNDTATTADALKTQTIVVPLRITDLSRALDESDKNGIKGEGTFWIACGSLRADSFCVQLRLKCKRTARRYCFDDDTEGEEERENIDDSLFFSYDVTVARAVCCLRRSVTDSTSKERENFFK